MTRSKSIAAPSIAPDTPLVALQDTEPTSKPSSPKSMHSAAPKARPDDTDTVPTTMPKKKPKTKEHPSKTWKTLWIKMMSTTRIPNVSFVAANLQSINEGRKRASLFSSLRSHNTDVFLPSKTGRPTPERVGQWTQACRDLKLSAVFTPFNNTAILWKSDSPVVTIDPESPPNNLRASFPFLDRVSDATFCVGDSKVRAVSIYAPSSDKPNKKTLPLSPQHRPPSTDDDPSPGPALLVGGDWNCVESQLLDSENQNGTNYGAQEMRDLAIPNNLSDVYRFHHPKGRATTNRSAPGTCRCLDRIHVSPDWVDLFRDHKIWAPVLESTHSMVVTRFQIPGAIDIGPGKFTCFRLLHPD
ncbi:BZ3500_MvSof-1268-A1-R1_Chr8-1g09753 [Microbotryum saponariae]|uniref:BZ3500_MvSof-1268-A1-R1_Chr8-1g09753 protein n=1 Tax=Microbotryum saponariae TaxID=289078 RepID=A0A2X0LPZ9_9BASI|nr:BZ3500_MvSof-1268-A1-R1_Chr8-1g09753 [Microbotryum saponariae]SDA08039.1 BZ3501_MvSof-1269-A2-R1_Chr8-1g09476 [Microbotryum saponariae]